MYLNAHLPIACHTPTHHGDRTVHLSCSQKELKNVRFPGFRFTDFFFKKMSSKEDFDDHPDEAVSYSFISQKELKSKFKWFEHKVHVGMKHRTCWQPYNGEENRQLLSVRRRRRFKTRIEHKHPFLKSLPHIKYIGIS